MNTKVKITKSYFAFDEEQASKLFAMCHASNFIELSKDNLLVAFFAGPYEGHSDTAIYLSYLKQGQNYKLCPLSDVVIKDAQAAPTVRHNAQWNPVFFRVDEQHIILIFKEGNQISTWQSMICHSYDNGETFSPAKELVPGDIGGRGPVRNKPLVTKSGKVLSPASLEDGPWRCFVDISDANFTNLQKSQEVKVDLSDPLLADRLTAAQDEANSSLIPLSAQSFTGQGIIQPTLFEDNLGVHMLMRSSLGYIFKADSGDEGLTWSKPYALELPNNNSGIDLEHLGNDLYLCCNLVKANFGKRTPLTLLVSTDGVNFQKIMDLDTHDGELSYPCIKAYQGGLLVSYTYDRHNIKLLELELIRD